MLARRNRRSLRPRSESCSFSFRRDCNHNGSSTSLVSMMARAMVETITMPVAAAIPPINDSSTMAGLSWAMGTDNM